MFGSRQLVNHKHVTVNGKVVNIPSYQLNPGDVVVGGQVWGRTVGLNAASRVKPLAADSPRVLTGDRTYSAPTVRLFPQNAADPTSYVFIDATVPDYETFLYSGKAGTTSVVVTPEENGITKETRLVH